MWDCSNTWIYIGKSPTRTVILPFNLDHSPNPIAPGKPDYKYIYTDINIEETDKMWPGVEFDQVLLLAPSDSNTTRARV